MPTIGVSIAVPNPAGAALQEYRVALGDEPARLIPTHVTLLPPTQVATSAVDAIGIGAVDEHLALAASQTEAFRIHLRGTGTFQPVSPVVFVNVVEGIAGCELLAAAVQAGPLEVHRAFPYHPHVTVAHHLEAEVLDRAFCEQADFECVFDVDRFWLYVHDAETGWVPQRDYVLG